MKALRESGFAFARTDYFGAIEKSRPAVAALSKVDAARRRMRTGMMTLGRLNRNRLCNLVYRDKNKEMQTGSLCSRAAGAGS